MKTTNKILLTTFILILILITIMAVAVRLNLKLGPVTEGSRNVVSEKREITAFHSIEASGAIQVELLQDEAISLTIEADDNLLELVVTEVTDQVLKIYLKERIGKHKAMDVQVAFVTLEALSVSAGAKVTSLNTLVGLALRHVISSGAISELSLDFDQLTVEASSGARAKLAGKVRELFVQSSSGANIEARELVCENATIKTSSGSINHIFVNNEMSIDASSGAIVKYYGQPTMKHMKTSSGAEVSAF
jgi:hypothetical protein